MTPECCQNNIDNKWKCLYNLRKLKVLNTYRLQLPYQYKYPPKPFSINFLNSSTHANMYRIEPSHAGFNPL